MEKFKGKILHREIKKIYIDRKNEKVIIKMEDGSEKTRNLKYGIDANHTYFMYEGYQYIVDTATEFNKDLLNY
jgi:hypothetical protein